MSKHEGLSVFELIRADGFISVNKKLAHAIGLYEATIYGELVSRYLYFLEHDRLTDDGWFYNTIADLEAGTAIGDRGQRTAIANLSKHGLIQCRTKGLPKMRYFKINTNPAILLSLIEMANKKIEKKKEAYESKTKSV